MPLAGLFLVRGLITVLDHRDGRTLEPPVVGFYLRIVVMQFVILAGGFFVIFLQGTLIPLILLVLLRTVIDVGIEGYSERITAALSAKRVKAAAQ